MLRKSMLFLVILTVLAALPAAAQDDAVASGFTFPRGFAYDEDGNLYVAEAGTAGDITLEVLEDGTSVMAGYSSQIVMVTPGGTSTPLLTNLPSIGGPIGDTVGIQRVIPNGDSLWLVAAEGKAGVPLSGTVIELDRESLRILNLIDLWAYEQANNTDGTEEIYSNPSDVNWDADGNLYIVDTGANTVFTWSEEAGLTPFISWIDNPVPTAIDFAPDGTVYISHLGQGIAPGSAHIEHWSADGKTLIETFEGLTAVTDVLVDDAGTVYAVQLITEFGEQGPNPVSGAVVSVSADGITPLAEGLAMPYGLGQDAEGNLLVSVGSVFAEPGSGAIVKVATGA